VVQVMLSTGPYDQGDSILLKMAVEYKISLQTSLGGVCDQSRVLERNHALLC
jgi:hypothetical protein